MDNLKYLEKPFLESLVISEDEKTFQGTVQWNIPNADIIRYFTWFGKSIESDTFSIGSLPCCSFQVLICALPDSIKRITTHDYIRLSEVHMYIIFNKKLPDSAWLKMKIYIGGIHKTFSISGSGKTFDKKIHLGKLCLGHELEHYRENSLDIPMDCSMKISIRELKCAFDKENVCYGESRDYDSRKETFKQESFSDVTIRIDGDQGPKLFKMHKTVLARIPYFQELFDANGSERCFELTNIQPEHFNLILTSLYSGDIPKLNFITACKLYILANDLKILDLKCLCSSYLGANLTEVNVTIVLRLSQEYDDTVLKRECFKFIKSADVEALTEKSVALLY